MIKIPRLHALKALFSGRLDFPIAPTSQAEIINGQILSSADNKQSYVSSGYSFNDIVYSVVFHIAEKVRIAPWLAYKIVDDAAAKSYMSLMSRKDISAEDLKLAAKYKKKAFEPFDSDLRLTTLLDRPNPEQSFSDLVGDSSIDKLLTGDRFLWGRTLSEGANKGKPFEVYQMSPQCVTIIVDRSDWPMKVVGYQLNWWGIKSILADQVMHDKYYNPNDDTNGQHFYGLSPLKAGHMRLDRSNAENITGLAAFSNMGPQYLLSTDDARLTADVSQQHVTGIKGALTSKEYRGAANYNKVAVSAYKMQATQIGLSPRDLTLTESEWSTLRFICNLYGAPSQIFNDPDGKIFNTVKEAEKAFTSRCALPLLNSFRSSFNHKLNTEWGYAGKKIFVDYDLTVYSELQEDLGSKWTWVKELPVSNGYKLDLMGLDHEEGQDEWMGKILVPSNYTTSEDYEQNQVDAALAAGDGGISQDGQGEDL